MGLPLSSGPLQGPQDENWPLQAVPDAVKIKHLQVQCEKTHMRVNIEFDRPFYGVIFSKGNVNAFQVYARNTVQISKKLCVVHDFPTRRAVLDPLLIIRRCAAF